MLKLFIDIDNVVRNLDGAVFGRPATKWVSKVKGLDFIDYITKNAKTILPNAKKTEYADVLIEWKKLASIDNLTFLSSQPAEWIPYTEIWLKKYFPSFKYMFTGTPNEKLAIVRESSGLLLDDYPKFDNYLDVMVIDRPYNRHLKNVFRITSRVEFLTVLMTAYTHDLCKIVGLCHKIAKVKGWWDTERNNGELIALMHSELSEALEALRHQDDSQSNVTEELVDCFVRIGDYCGARGLDFQREFAHKMVKNMDRPHRHGKKF